MQESHGNHFLIEVMRSLDTKIYQIKIKSNQIMVDLDNLGLPDLSIPVSFSREVYADSDVTRSIQSSLLEDSLVSLRTTGPQVIV